MSALRHNFEGTNAGKYGFLVSGRQGFSSSLRKTSLLSVLDRYNRNLSLSRKCNRNVNSITHDKYFYRAGSTNAWRPDLNFMLTNSIPFWSEKLLCLKSEILLLQCNQTDTCVFLAVKHASQFTFKENVWLCFVRKVFTRS